MSVVGHALWPPPGPDAVDAVCAERGIGEADALALLLEPRAKFIEQEKSDPYRYGWEPTVWKVADALLDFPFCDDAFVKVLARRFEWASGSAEPWEEFKRRMRARLGFAKPAMMLLVLGGNRSGKSEYAAKRCQMMLTRRPGARVNPYHESEKRSKLDQQPLFYKYMPREWQKQVQGTVEYIKYKQQTGFSDDSFVNPLGSRCLFQNYTQSRTTAVEGLKPDLLAPDELCPWDWVETMLLRLPERDGRGILTFTAVEGYSPTVRMFCEGAEIRREVPGYVLPKDGGAPDLGRALGLSEADLAELREAHARKRVCFAPESVPEDCLAWLEDEVGGVVDTGARVFESVPRVMAPRNDKLGVIFFHCADNPYARPLEVMEMGLSLGERSKTLVRVYGVAEKSFHNVFTRFSRRVHVIRGEDVPGSMGAKTVGRVTNFQVIDPAGDRPFFMTWLRDAGERRYCYREWPGRYVIPGLGVPGPWAVSSGRLKGRNDGDRGEAQEGIGWGLLRYKFEMARLERWDAYLKWLRDEAGANVDGGWEKRMEEAVLSGVLFPEYVDLRDWDERDGAEERVETRIVDSRAASNPRVENDRPVTLFEDLLDLGLNVELAPGDDVADGVGRIASALDYDQDADQSFFNAPKLLVSADCQNVIFSLETWMNVEGGKGATKDPIDCLRYFYLSEWSQAGAVVDGGGRQAGFFYGRGSSGARTADVNSKISKWMGGGRRAVR